MSVCMKLLFVISLTLTLTLNHVVVHSARVRLSDLAGLMSREKSEIVNKHNELRAREGASDMEMMTWNESLAVAAENWVKQCNTEHSKTPLPGTNFTEYGQRYSVIEHGQIDLFLHTIQRWYNEKDMYAYDTLRCKPGKQCHRYTQVVWATSRQIGCAYMYCSRMNNAHSAQFLACNYLPAGGNEQGQRPIKPFKKGPACSQCEGGAGWCKDGLCNSQCSKAGKDCSCMAICRNCAKLNPITCRCSCTDGWHGPDCTDRCEDKRGHCTELEMPDDCKDGQFRRECPVMCDLCKWNPKAKAGKCPPAYALAVVAEQAKLVKPNSTDDSNGSQHQQQRITLILLSNVILSLTITWKALLVCDVLKC